MPTKADDKLRDSIAALRRDALTVDRAALATASLEVVLDGLRRDAASILDTLPECPKAKTLEPFRSYAQDMVTLLWNMAKLSPEPSTVASDAIHRLTCRLFKRSDQCRHPEGVTLLRWTGQGYFAVTAEVGRSFAFAQRYAGKAPVPDVTALVDSLFESLGRAIESTEFSQELTNSWHSGFDDLVKVVVNHAMLGNWDELRAVRNQFLKQKGLLEPTVDRLFNENNEVGRIGSWLDAMER